MIVTLSERAVSPDALKRFVADEPKQRVQAPTDDLLGGRIEGCKAHSILPASDDRGDLFELLTSRDGDIEPIVHIYQVFAAPGSLRAWVYHSRQTDRLCFTTGSFRVVLCDLREDSQTAGNLVTLLVGAAAPTLLHIPAFVAHGVQNIGSERTPFVNIPTAAYCHDTPDKCRLPFDSPLIPFTW